MKLPLLLTYWQLVHLRTFAYLPFTNSFPVRSRCHIRTPVSLRLKSGGDATDSARMSSPDPQQDESLQLQLLLSHSNNNDDSSPWSPPLRKIMTGLAVLGATETAYLTASKLSGDSVLCPAMADSISSCQDILNGPYSVIPFLHNTNIPVSAIGFLAYTMTALVAIAPLLIPDANKDDTDTLNRISLLILVTAMGTFSTYLMTLLIVVLHQSCFYCLLSASFSWALTTIAWLGGALPSQRQQDTVIAVQSNVATIVLTTVASVLLFTSVEMTLPSTVSANGEDATAVTTARSTTATLIPPPPSPPTITTDSSPQALMIAKDLKQLKAKMYGAYWCSHCYDQKQSLGKQAYYSSVQYVECSKEGIDSQASLCKERNVPGYPTWEMDGQLFPGEQDLDELQDIIKKVKEGRISD